MDKIMDKLMELEKDLEPLSKQVNEYGEKIIMFMNPDIDRSVSPVMEWPLARFDHALAVLLAYIAFVLFGLFIKAITGGSSEAPPREKQKLTVGQKLANEPLVMPLMVIYNVSQVALCGYMMAGAMQHYFAAGYKPICNPFDQKESGMAAVLWVFYVSKVLDFADTFFFVVRRKWNQLTFLHVYHHASIFMFYWLNLNVGYDGDVYYTIVLNSFIHFVMYSYYAVTTFNIFVPKAIKQVITKMQMIQFVSMNVQAIYILYMGCPYPRRVTFVYLFYIISLYILFDQFAKKAYGKKKDDKKKDN